MRKAQIREKNNIIPFSPSEQTESEFSDAVADDSEIGSEPEIVPTIRHSTRTLAIVFTDIVESSAAKSEMGIHKAQTLELEHKRLLLGALNRIRYIYRDKAAQAVRTEGDSYIFVFSNSGEAVHFALLAQKLHREARGEQWHDLCQFRVGIHSGEVIVEDGLKVLGRSGGIGDIKGIQADTAARIMSIACGGQILCSYTVFDNARQSLSGIELEGIADKLIWKHHGYYLLKGRDDFFEICEIGEKTAAPLKKPPGNAKAKPIGIFRRMPKSLFAAMIFLILLLSGGYVYLNDFRQNPTPTEAVVDDLKYKIMQLHGIYETIKDHGTRAALDIREKAPRFAEQLLNLSDKKMGMKYRITKYQFAAYALGMAAAAELYDSKTEHYADQAAKYADQAISAGREGLRLIGEAKRRCSVGDEKDHEIYDWIVTKKREEVIHFMLALSFAVKVRTGDDSAVAEVRKHLNAMPSSYKERYPPETEKVLKWVIDNKLP